MLRIALVVGLIALGAASAGAEGSFGAGDTYVELEVGPSFPADSDLSANGQSGELSYDPGFLVGGAAGVRFLEVGRAEVGLSYRQADTDEIRPGSSSPSGDVGLFTAMANGYVDLPVNLPVTPYVGFGIGVGVVMADFRVGSTRVDDDETEFAYNVMAGLVYDLTEDVALRAGYRYLATTDANIQGVDTEIDIHELVLGARYSF